ncbi:NAD(P)/FAD-dependent oxidoreductase [Leifsonia sp. McL0608]|uniref:NAD(P)/FAD-dependent oxidoreductase n=1 Tax=Leifsonia sp. McL0608 TaxID=3143537 RepID=UPI003D9C5DFF
MTWDAIVLGGGAAGLSGGIVLARTGARVVVIEDQTPRNAPATHMHGFLSRDGMEPSALLRTGREELVGFGGRSLEAHATHAERHGESEFRVVLKDGSELIAPAMLVATGLRDVLPNIPGAQELWGDLVHHCPHCHGREVAGSRIAVIGGQNAPMSVHQAGLMRRYSEDVAFYTNGIALGDDQRVRLEAIGVALDSTPVVHIGRDSDPKQRGVELALEDGRHVRHDTAFVAPMMEPRDAAVASLDLVRAEGGPWIDVGSTGRTSMTGVWAAGNISNPRAQVITAAGEGSTAAIDIAGYLLERDLVRAVRGESVSWFAR